jgi:Holliday junction resolvase RusA-like endonuclease
MSIAPAPITASLSFFVDGHPQTAGSKKALPIMKGGVRVGTRVVEDGSEANRAAKRTWRQDIQLAARQAMAAQGWERSHEAVALEFVFYRSRPASHYGTGRNARVLKPSAPAWPIGKPDALKMARGAEDALTGVAFADDAQVVHGSQTKLWTCRYEGREGVAITLRLARFEGVAT